MEDIIINLLSKTAWSRELLEVPETQFIPPKIHHLEKKEKAPVEYSKDHAAIGCICPEVTFCSDY